MTLRPLEWPIINFLLFINKKIKLPLTYDGNTFLSFNGEIYNFLDLKDKYKIEDKKFIYKTDTEILYHF